MSSTRKTGISGTGHLQVEACAIAIQRVGESTTQRVVIDIPLVGARTPVAVFFQMNVHGHAAIVGCAP